MKIEDHEISCLGRFCWRYLPYRRAVIMQNIQQVFGDGISDMQKQRLAQASYTSLLRLIKDIVCIRFKTIVKIKDSVEVKGHQYLLDVAEQKKGVLICAGHMGSWEYTPIGGILNFTEFQGRIHFIRRRLVNKFVERLVFKHYYAAGLQVIPQRNSLAHVCEVLEQNHAVVFVMDQHASLVNRDGIAVEFFGKKAGTYRSLASIAAHYELAVVPASCYRLANGKHVMEFHEPIPFVSYPTLQETLYQNTLRYNQALEQCILKHPAQWIWLHKRWKLA